MSSWFSFTGQFSFVRLAGSTLSLGVLLVLGSQPRINLINTTRRHDVSGRGVPALDHAQLHAIPHAIWQNDQNRFVYQSWVKEATAAIRTEAP